MKPNPYDLRAGLLGQAQGILDHQYHAQLETIQRKIELGVLKADQVTWPTPASAEDIIAEAEKLYKFVLTK